MSRRADDNLVAGRRVDEWMADAAALTGGTFPHPNPRVGAIVLSAAGRVVGQAAHRGAGRAHAEVAALDAAGDAARGGTLIVTLEPCSHHGRTPPCVAAILASGVTTVVAGATDPDDRVSGAGFTQLESAGISVLRDAAVATTVASDPAYFHHRRTGRPFVTVKTAVTIDGQVAAADGSSRWITSPEARRDGHALRAEADAVMIGAGTLRADDPALTVRRNDYSGPQPLPVVVAGETRLPETAALWERSPLIYRTRIHGDEPATCEVIVTGGAGDVDPAGVLKDLGSRQVLGVLVEGGPKLIRSLVTAGAVDRWVLYVGSKLAGGTGMSPVAGTFATIGDAAAMRLESVSRVGPDARMTYVPAEAV